MMKEGNVSGAQKDLSFVICIGNTAFFAQKRPELAKIPYTAHHDSKRLINAINVDDQKVPFLIQHSTPKLFRVQPSFTTQTDTIYRVDNATDILFSNPDGPLNDVLSEPLNKSIGTLLLCSFREAYYHGGEERN